MKCLEREQLFAYAHGMLETRRAAEVRAHLEACAACREVVTEYLRLDSALEEWKTVEPSAGFDARVRQAVQAQGEASGSFRWGGLFALTWPRWLAPAGLAILVGAVALGVYRSRRIPGPAASERSAQRLSPAALQAPQPSAATAQHAEAAKKLSPATETLLAKQKAGPLMASQEAPAPSGRRLAERENAVAAAGGQNPVRATTPWSPPYQGEGSGVVRRAAAPPAPSAEIQRNAMARAAGVPEATGQPSTSATGGVLAWRHAEGTNQPQRVLPAAPATGQQIAAEAQPQATPTPPQPAPPPPASARITEAQVPAPVDSLGHQLVATPMKAPPAAKALRLGMVPASVQAHEEGISPYRSLQALEDFDLLSDFDVLSELPQEGKKVDNSLLELSPEEQERVLANNERFQSLPPERQERIRENLRRWNTLRPEQKDLIRQRQEVFASLSPAQRRQARAIFPAWRRLELARRQAILAAFRQAQSLPPDQREKYLSSSEVQQQFSPDECHVLESLSQLLPGS